MEHEALLRRVVAEPGVCGGRSRIAGTRIEIAIILDALGEGLSHEQILGHYPALSREDIQAAALYGAELAREALWKVTV